MKKKFLTLSLIALSGLALASCGKGNSEDTPLLLSSQELDKVFNPFYSSSAPDSQVVGMTQISMLGNNSKGEVTYGENEAYKGTDKGGHIKCSANKIYMALSNANGAALFGMRFVGGEATGIDNVNGENGEDIIYDLQGRRLVEITQPGIYIVNGKQVFVK